MFFTCNQVQFKLIDFVTTYDDDYSNTRKKALCSLKRAWLDGDVYIHTTFMSTRSSSNHVTLSLSFVTLAMYMQASAIKCGGWIRIRSILYVSLTIPLHSSNIFNITRETVTTNIVQAKSGRLKFILPSELHQVHHTTILKESVQRRKELWW